MRHLLTAVRRPFLLHRSTLQVANYKPQKPQPPPSPPSPPKPPKKPVSFTLHGESWEDEYNWMSQLNDKVAMRHMDVYMEQEEKYTEAVMSDTDRLQSKLQSEIASRLAADLSTPPVLWGPWLYYRRVEEGKQYPVLCRSLNQEFISNKSPSAGSDFTSGRKIEQKLPDYNQEAERFGDFRWGKVRKMETLSINKQRYSMSLCKPRDCEGGLEVDLYGADFRWGKVRKMETLSINKQRYSMSLCKPRDCEGGLEVGLSLPRVNMDAFAAPFAEGIPFLSLNLFLYCC